ncbi:hypothetical protein ACOJQI_20100 [Bacillus salacetis]|uniref:hypothetical protein n=1 Tax=Bacillus salacetis TaxID=2315464 RepID=UPI003B9E30DF
MSAVEDCHRITEKLHSLVHREVDEEEREDLIKEVEWLLGQRETLLSQISPPFTEKEGRLGSEIVSWNKAINQKLKTIQLFIKRDINGVSNKKDKAQRYSNPYDNLQTDGYFYDKKK